MIRNSALTSGQLATRHWRKSSYSGTAGNCIEVTSLGREALAVRDSKDPTGPVLTFTVDQWSAFTFTVKCAPTNSIYGERLPRS
ncbi:MAG: DUF397 domain-containing protein [Actinomycetota bacterium]|nr:DUF397 domain-containing protein [Actinomycetota bacterium]